MNNSELDKLLKSAPLPGPRDDFLPDLPANVQQALARSEPDNFTSPTSMPHRPTFFWRLAAPLTFAAVCIAIGFFWGAHSRKSDAVQRVEIAEAGACWREATALFPNQLKVIVFDQRGSRLVLSEKPDQPVSAPIFLKLCNGKNCSRFVTYSGQRIQVNGDTFEVLINLKGEVLLVGESTVWKSASESTRFGSYNVFARPLAKS